MPTETFKSTCCYCGVGCGVEILKHPDGRLELRGDESHPANRGALCSKGRALLHTVRARENRLHYPVMRTTRSGPRDRVSWDTAISRIAEDFQRIIKKHGPDSVAFYISGQCLTEEYYLASKIVKGFLRTNNIDTNSRLCMSSAVCGYKATLGADAPPICYDDIDHCDTFFIAGANPAWCHPVLFRRIEARRAADPNVRIIVIDPRRTASAQAADLHLQLKPGTDLALLLGIARQLVHTGQTDPHFLANHVEGAAGFLRSVEPWTLPRTAEVTGLNESDIASAADWLAGNRRFLSMWTMGLNQSPSGTDNNIAIISLSLLTGKIGKPGCGPFSLTGQPNAMGGREVGGMATLLHGHRDLSNPDHRQRVAAHWGVDSIPEKPGLTAIELFDAARASKIKALWIIATNPVATMPAAWNIEKALAATELVVVQDIYPTETTDFADVILPAATWLEKTGTMTNSDRHIALLQKAIDPPGEALPDTEILQRFAQAMGWQSSFTYPTPAEIFAEHAALTAGTDIDISALSHTSLQNAPTQWPAPIENQKSKAENPGTPRLYTDHHFPTPSRRARLHPLHFEPRTEPLSEQFPLILTTGRLRDQWHTMTKTAHVNRLNTHDPAPFCEIHPADALPRNIADGDILTITSARGDVRLPARLSADIRPGVIFLPMHWGKKLAGDRGRTNNLTSPITDPVSHQPALKFAAVQVEKHIPKKRRILIAGAGSAALAFIEAHRRFNQTDDLILLGGESLPVYNRVLLPQYIEGSAPWDSLIRADRDSLNPHRVVFHPNTLVSRIDRQQKSITDARGRQFTYDLLILATGSRPAVHYDGPIPRTGVHTLRSRSDADEILARAKPGTNIIIQGGGLLGIEAAAALLNLGCHITILQRSGHLMNKQLDAIASTHLAEELTHRGIQIFFHTDLVELAGAEQITAARVSQNESGIADAPRTEKTLPCDLFLIATGTLPNKELAGAAGLDCNKGILTNPHLQTSDPDIFAIGECAETDGQTVGTTAAATAHANALAEFLRGNEHAPHRHRPMANILKIRDFPLATAGLTDPPPDDLSYEIITLHDPRRRYYQKCIIQYDRLVGIICMGDTARFSQYLEWIQTGLELDTLRETLLREAPATSSAAGPILCSCHHVAKSTLLQAMPSCNGNLSALCRTTRAGTGCGSCIPEIRSLLTQTSAAQEHSEQSATPPNPSSSVDRSPLITSGI